MILRALVTHGDPVDLERTRVLLKRLGFKNVWTNVSHSGTVHSLGVAYHKPFKFDLIVIAGDAPPGPTGLHVLEDLRLREDLTPVVLLTDDDPFGRQSWPSRSVMVETGGHVDVIEQAIRELVPGLDAA